MVVVTNSLTSALRVGFQRKFQDALSSAPPQWDGLSTRVPSNSTGNTRDWIGQFPKLRERSGDRPFENIKEHGYSVVNNLCKVTVDIPRTAVEDDGIGVYVPLFREMDYAAGTYSDEIVFGLLKNGMPGTCCGDEAFFAVDHPTCLNVDNSSNAGTVSNWLCPAAVDGTVTDGTPWFMLDASRPLRPFIFQERAVPELQVITNPNNDYVFVKNRIPYGTRYRCSGRYGFWQQTTCSTQELNATNFAAALEAVQSFHADGGRPLGLSFGGETGTMLAMPPSLQSAARRIIPAKQDLDGGNNIRYRTATLPVNHWLI